MKVNIYLHTTANAPKKKVTAYGFVLECETKKGPATLTHIGHFDDVGKNTAELLALKEALGKLNKGCSLTIYTTPYIETAFNIWMPFWETNGWINRKGKPVDEIYKEIKNLLKPHIYSFKTDFHSYSEWLSRETKQEEKKCLTSMESSTRQQSSGKQ